MKERELQKSAEVQKQLQQAEQGQGLEELQVKIMELEMKLQDQERLMEQLPPGV